MRIRRVLALAVCMVFLSAGLAHAAYTLEVGTSYSSIGGGSVNITKLDGQALPWVFCVDHAHTITAGNTYNATEVTTNGFINGSFVNNAGQVAWLLEQHATSSNTSDQALALQASIWHVIDSSYNPGFTTGSSLDDLYDSYLSTSSGKNGTLSNFRWITPKIAGDTTVYQGLVAPVPIPGAAWLLGSGLLGLIGLKRRRGKEV